VIESPYFPAIRVVALLAEFAKPPFVLIIRLMTGQALDRGVLVLGGQMAFLTGHYCMQADQRETRNVMLKTDLCLPAFHAVAFIAFFTLFACMRVVEVVAGITVRLHFLLEDVCFMTGGAGGLFMLTLQFEFCIFVMVELGLAPASLLVAFITFGTVSAIVCIVVLVAGNTLRFYFDFVGVLLVAMLAA